MGGPRDEGASITIVITFGGGQPELQLGIGLVDELDDSRGHQRWFVTPDVAHACLAEHAGPA